MQGFHHPVAVWIGYFVRSHVFADIIGDDITAHLQLGTDLTLGKAVV
jgi:hypothetical protein